jgi:adenosylhomocysteine nucleosidase
LPTIAIVAALDREIRPLIKNWPSTKIHHEGRDFIFYHCSYAIAVSGGIGPECARRAAEAAIARYSPQLVISAGIAGALVPELQVGETIFPALVIDTRDGSSHATGIEHALGGNSALGRTTLASYPEIASARQKRQLANSYRAHAVDMEAAAVARAAELHNLRFLAVKAISDDVNSEISELNRFIRQGRLASKSLIFYLIPRPWLWRKIFRLARNTELAAQNLCRWLREAALPNTIVPGVISRLRP